MEAEAESHWLCRLCREHRLRALASIQEMRLRAQAEMNLME